jgi:predicted esterase
MIKEHHFKVEKTARYYTIGEAGPNTKYFWIVCHGYGQLAKFFIRKFDVLAAEDTFVLAPEGLSKFYWEGDGKRIPVANWMTREDRLNEIEDYANMIQSLYEQFKAQCAEDVKIVLLGFSQGCATQVRWILHKMPDFDSLIMWAGLFPEDLDYLPFKEYLSDKKLYFVYGTMDIYLTEERHREHTALLKKNELAVKEKVFDGPHKVIREVLREVAEEVKKG